MRWTTWGCGGMDAVHHGGTRRASCGGILCAALWHSRAEPWHPTEQQCGHGQRYSDCVSSCPASCMAAGTAEEGHCRDDCASGCECTPGLLLDRGACIPQSACPCLHRGHIYAPGQSIRQRCNQW